MLPTVFLDIDNTVIPARQKITDKTFNALKGYIDAGGNLVFTTGKVPLSLYELIRSLDYEDSYHMGGNGAVIFNLAKDEHQLLASVGARAQSIIHNTMEHGLDPYIYFENEIVAPFKDIDQTESDHFVNIGEPAPYYIPIEDIDYDNIMKVLFYIDEDEIEKETIVRNAVVDIEGLDVIRTAPFLIEVHDHKQTKARPAEMYCEMYNLDIKKDCIAVGDSENDLPMLQAVGKAYLVDNAAQAMKAHGFEVIKACADDGVADLLNEIRTKYQD